MKKQKPIQMWVTPTFKGFLYKEKAKNPNRSLMDIMDEIANNKLEEKQDEKKKLFEESIKLFLGEV